MALGSKTDLFANYQKEQEQIGVQQTTPFADLDIQPISTTQAQEKNIQHDKERKQRVKSTKIQTQEETWKKDTTMQDVVTFISKPKISITANGRTLKTTKNGNRYVYEDVYDHRQDVKMTKEEEAVFSLRIPKKYKAYLESVARGERISLNQLILRAIREFVKF